MNDKYPYPIENAAHIPSSKEEAMRAVNLIDEFRDDPQSACTSTFLDGWFAIHFIGDAPHPDEIEAWPKNLKPLVTEAWRRQKIGELTDEQLYCSDSQQQGIRLQLDGNLKCYVIGKQGQDLGYISAHYDPEKGNQPILTGIPAKAYIYESPKAATHACRHLELDSIDIYASSPTEDLECADGKIIPIKDLFDKEVVIQTPEGLFLYRDGKTLGESPVRACKYRLYGDNVEQQLQQIKTELGVTWKWVEYDKI